MDKGVINFGDCSISGKELFKLYCKGKKHVAAVPHCLKNTRLVFDIDSFNGLEYQYVKSVINAMVHKLFKSSKNNYIHLEEKNESGEKYHIRYPNIIISIRILKKICKALNNYFGKIVVDPQCYTLRYPGFDKFHSNKKQWLPNTAYYPVDGSSLTMDYYKQCYLCCDDLKTTPLKVKESGIRSGLLCKIKGGGNIKIMYNKEERELVSTQIILDSINNDKSLLLDKNAIIIGIKTEDDDFFVVEIKFNEYNKLIPDTYNLNDVVYIAMNVKTLRSKQQRKLMLYDRRSSIDRLTCSGNTKPQQLWINVRSKYIDINNKNKDNEENKEEKQNDDDNEDKQIKMFYNAICPTAKELELKNEITPINRNSFCLIYITLTLSQFPFKRTDSI